MLATSGALSGGIHDLLSPKTLEALSVPNRVTILSLICSHGFLTPSAVTALSGISDSTVTHHLKALLDSGLLAKNKSGQSVTYWPNYSALEELQLFITGLMSKKVST